MNQKQPQLDEEELQILQNFERGEFESLKNFSQEKHQLEAAAKRTLQKEKRINIRISARDLEQIQKRAVAEGMP
jgi:predicted DNA binding CopG/RHH family protein